MTGNSRLQGHPDPATAVCGWCWKPLPSQGACCPSRRAYLIARAEGRSVVDSLALGRAIADLPHRAVGSSSTTTGSTRFRGTSGTALSSSVCRRLKRTRLGATSTSERSQRGQDGGKTSASSKRLSAVGEAIGLVDHTPAELREMPLDEFEKLIRTKPTWGER